jgi:hypothetical protein
LGACGKELRWFSLYLEKQFVEVDYIVEVGLCILKNSGLSVELSIWGSPGINLRPCTLPLKIIYYSLIQSHISYGISVYDGNNKNKS